ncbi:MAG: M20 family metallopeptidase [Promethearchaeota archaeon]
MDINNWIEENKAKYIEISDKIWDFSEINFIEFQSAQFLAEKLEEEGFSVEREVAEIPTAFIASYGSGDPIIAILGEYDALPGLSQDKVPYKKKVETREHGHACGHNLLGVAGLYACIAVKEAMKMGEISGTLRYYGCPAEEGGAGKTFMVKAGLFDDVDIALCWHPDSFNAIWTMNCMANTMVYFKFHGRTAHAAADPYNGRSALDAVELMNIGANYLREHMIPDARIHYIITNGGQAPNIVPAEAESYYIVRGPTTAKVQDLYKRLLKVAEGAALMTETTFDVKFAAGMSNLLPNRTIERVFLEKLNEFGPIDFNAEERKFAAEIKKSFPKGDILDSLGFLGPEIVGFLKKRKDQALIGDILPYKESSITIPGSTDVGDVSWVVPLSQFTTACAAIGTPGHSWQTVAQGGMGIGHKGMILAAKVLASSAIEFLSKPDLVKKAKEEFQKHRKDNPYVSPIPDGAKPFLEQYKK